MVDDADYDSVSKLKWYPFLSGSGYYLSRTSTIDGKKRTVSLHRLLMGEPKGMQVDHINGNTLDNRRSNLRVVTASENQKNGKVHRAGRPVGVHKTQRGYYQVYKKIAGERFYVGASKHQYIGAAMYEAFTGPDETSPS